MPALGGIGTNLVLGLCLTVLVVGPIIAFGISLNLVLGFCTIVLANFSRRSGGADLAALATPGVQGWPP